VADSLQFFANELEKVPKGQFNQALQTLLASETKKFMPVLFEGDNYDEKWHQEAEKRGLPNITNSVDALQGLTSELSLDLFARHKVYTKRELAARQEINLTKYVKKIRIEAMTASVMAHTQILPACFAYAEMLGRASPFIGGCGKEIATSLSEMISNFYKALLQLDKRIEELAMQEENSQPFFARDHIVPQIDVLRAIADRLEQVLPDTLWPLPKYFEMLFIR
jgi:glutamine synthetase